MAAITLTSYFANLNGWQGNLLDAGGGDAQVVGTATSFQVTLGASSQFAGYVITATGSDFDYINGVVTQGEMSGLTITDAQGHAVLTVSGLAQNSLSSDLGHFAEDLFGYDVPGGHIGASWLNIWSNLLSGNDVFTGTAGDDYRGMIGLEAGNDTYNMLAGNDYVNGGMGRDTVNGGDGWDTYSFGLTAEQMGAGILHGITVRVGLGTVVDCWGFTDHVTGIEKFLGSVTRDVFYGGAGEDNFYGLRGRDAFFGGAGNDWVRYDEDTNFGGGFGIVADLRPQPAGGAGYVRDGFGNHDRVTSIENVSGTRYDDVFIGAAGQNNFAGGEGTDRYNGGGGADFIFFDWRFSNQTQTGIVVDLSRATGRIQNDGYGNVEESVSIENIDGSSQADAIKGSTGANHLGGLDGKDTLTGGGGADVFAFYNRDELGDADVITDFHVGAGVNRDTLQIYVSNWGASTTLHLVNGPAATEAVGTFVFRPFNHTLYWDEDGTGGLGKIAVCVLNNVTALTVDNFDLV